MNLILELSVFLLMFVLFRTALSHSFPPLVADEELNEEGKKALRNFKRKYFVTVALLVILLTSLFILLIYYAFLWMHREEGWVVLVSNTSSIFMPAVLLALLIIMLAGRSINRLIQKRAYFLFFDGYLNKDGSLNRRTYRRILLIPALAVLVLMLYYQSQTYMKTNGEMVITKAGAKNELIINVGEEVEIEKLNERDYRISQGKNSFDTRIYSGDIEKFIEQLK